MEHTNKSQKNWYLLNFEIKFKDNVSINKAFIL